jgi:hypothetical protein
MADTYQQPRRGNMLDEMVSDRYKRGREQSNREFSLRRGVVSPKYIAREYTQKRGMLKD